MSGSPDRSAPPPPGARRAPDFPRFDRQRLGSGLELLVATRREVPLVDVALLCHAGGDRNPLDRPGLASLVAGLVDEGSRRRDGFEIASEVERLGGGLAAHADWNAVQIELSLLAADFRRGLEIVTEVATEPAFPESEIERLRTQALTELERRRQQPGAVAEEALADCLYPGTPYGRPLTGTRESLRAITRDEIEAFHRDRYPLAGAHLVVVGDVEADAVRSQVEELLASAGGAGSEPPPAIVPPASVRRVVVFDRPAGAQTELRIGQVGPPRTHPDRTRLGLISAVLGGKFTSRLNLVLRESMGITYGVSSRFVDRTGPGPFTIAAAVATDAVGRAVEATLAELERLRQEEIPAEELAETQSYLIGVVPYTLQTNGAIVTRLADLALHALPSDQLARALAEVESATAGELLELARRHLRPESCAIVAVGPASELVPQLERFGAVELRTDADSAAS